MLVRHTVYGFGFIALAATLIILQCRLMDVVALTISILIIPAFHIVRDLLARAINCKQLLSAPPIAPLHCLCVCHVLLA